MFICYESIFPDEVRQFAKNGAQVFVNISNDGWYGDSGAYAQHLKQARMRAIENARWLLRSHQHRRDCGHRSRWASRTNRAAQNSHRAASVLCASTIATTFYTRHGDWLAYLCAIISIGGGDCRSYSRQRQTFSMIQELEHEYSALQQKVRELREYL